MVMWQEKLTGEFFFGGFESIPYARFFRYHIRVIFNGRIQRERYRHPSGP
jgi:hypothetical protein